VQLRSALISLLALAASVAAVAGPITVAPNCTSAGQTDCAALTGNGYYILDTTQGGGSALDTVLTGGVLINYQTFAGKPSGADSALINQAVLDAQAKLATSFICGGAATSNCYAGPGTPANPDQGAFNQMGAVVVTNLETSSFVFQDTPVNQRFDQYSTTLLITLNGTQIVLSETFQLPFNEPTVQLALQQAELVLRTDHAVFGSPVLVSNSTTLQNSTNSLIVTGSVLDGNQTVTTTTFFGPGIVNVGNEANPPTPYSSGFPAWVFILPGQTDINVATDNEYLVSRNAITTDAFLTSQTFDLDGIANASPVPEPPSAALFVAALLGLAIVRLGRVKSRV
jgi:hypothetical protein